MQAKNVIILHGTGDKPNDFWFPYLKNNLENRGYSVWLPQLPNAEKPSLEEWLPFVFNNGKFSKDTILIGHSAGAQLILSLLEKYPIKIKQVILVSGYSKALRETANSKNGIENFKWEKIKGKYKQIIFINSDNDPWGCNDQQGKIMLDNLGGVLIIPKGEGHMGSTTNKQPYKKFPLLIKLISD